MASDGQISGKVYENFIAMEVVRHLPWAETPSPPLPGLRPAPRWGDRPPVREPGGSPGRSSATGRGRCRSAAFSQQAAPYLRAGAERPLQRGHGAGEEQAHGVGGLVGRRLRGSSVRIAADAITTACWMTCQRSTAANWPPDSACTSSNASRWARISSFRRSLKSSPAPSPNAKGNGNSVSSLTVCRPPGPTWPRLGGPSRGLDVLGEGLDAGGRQRVLEHLVEDLRGDRGDVGAHPGGLDDVQRARGSRP